MAKTVVKKEIPSKYLEQDYVVTHLNIGMRPKTGDCKMLTRNSKFYGIEKYLYLLDDDEDDIHILTVYATQVFLDRVGISLNDAWDLAECNVVNNTYVNGIESFLNIPFENELPLFVVTNKVKFWGASSILNAEELKAIAVTNDTDELICLPSSIHEFIVIPNMEDIADISGFTDMVKEVNESQVPVNEQLSNMAYLYNVESEEVTEI